MDAAGVGAARCDRGHMRVAAVPADLVSLPSRHVERAIHWYGAGDRATAARQAAPAPAILPCLAEPYEVKGPCQASGGRPAACAATLARRRARARKLYFLCAEGLAQGAARQDSTATRRAAMSCNPRDSGPITALQQLSGARPAARSR